MKGREYKNLMYEGLSKMLKAIANPYRLEMIGMLSQGEKSVEEIVQITGLTFANASQHLQILKNNNILKSRREGHYVYYSLANYGILSLYQHTIRYAIKEIAELERTMDRQREDNHSKNAVTLEELEDMISNENVLLIDVRPEDEFISGHIKGAVSVPIYQLLSRLKEISKKKTVVAYCRGPFCVLADEAVRLLNEHGYKVRRLDEGYPEWKMRQLEMNQLN